MHKHIINHTGRKAIAMIELIFAIVIMGIVLLSIPNLLSVAAKSSYVSLQQEAIATAASHINLILTKEWDENNTDETFILQVTNGDSSLAARSGVAERPLAHSVSGVSFARTIGAEGGDQDDIDDFDATIMTLRNYADTEVTSGDNIDINITIATNIAYIDDTANNDYNTSSTIQYNFKAPTTATTNIKSISTQLTTNNIAIELEKQIDLEAFSCNIGGYTPVVRILP